jgi:hypothetical protein
MLRGNLLVAMKYSKFFLAHFSTNLDLLGLHFGFFGGCALWMFFLAQDAYFVTQDGCFLLRMPLYLNFRTQRAIAIEACSKFSNDVSV